MPTKSGQYIYMDDGSAAQQVYDTSAENRIQPVDLQSRYTQTIQTHNAVSVPATTGNVLSSWIDCDGFDKIAITLLNDASTNSSIDLNWSHDNTTWHSNETVVASSASARKAGITDVKARYARVSLFNTDAAAHTMSAWAYLKV